LKRQAVPSAVMRRQVLRFSAGPISGQYCTSDSVRPQPLHTASPWLVEQMAMHGVSGVLAYQVCHAAHAAAEKACSSAKS
jgi:hypothetical protein